MEEDETEEEILEKLSAELPVTGYPPQPSRASILEQ